MRLNVQLLGSWHQEAIIFVLRIERSPCLTADNEEEGKHSEEEEGDWWEQDNGDKDQTCDLASLSGKDKGRSRCWGWRPKRRPRRPRAK